MRYKISSITISAGLVSLLLLVSTLAQSEGIWESPWFSVGPKSGWIFSDVYFVEPQKGWVVGSSVDTGFIAHTSGDGWKAQFYASRLVPLSVQFLTPNKGWVAGYIQIEGEKKTEGVLLYTEDGGKHWIESHRFPPWKLCFLQFVTESHGWVIGWAPGADNTRNSVILATADGGEHWTLQYEGVNEILTLVLCFTDVNNGWVLGSTWSPGKVKGVLLHTTDGGKNWIHLPVGEKSIKAIDFISASEGWAVETFFVKDDETYHWTIFHTQDGGQTWVEQKTGTQARTWISKICFVDENEGWAMIGGNILHTTDGGLRWIVQEHELVDDRKIWLRGIYFLDEKRGWIVGMDILTTTDGGVTWFVEPQKPCGSGALNEIFFVNSKDGWIVGEGGAIFHTADGGLTWDTQESSTSLELLGAHFINVKEGWVVGDEGTILHTTDGGLTWEKQRSGTQFSLNDVQFLDAQEGWVVGELLQGKQWSGVILHTVDGGNKWETVRNVPKDVGWLKDVHFVNPQTGWIVGLGSILHTDDGGKSWREQRCPELGSPYYSIYFVDDLTGWVIGASNDSFSAIAHSVDGGDTFKIQYNNRNNCLWHIWLETLYFANRQEGFAVGRNGCGILHTTDGGQTWTIQETPPGHSLSELQSICYGGKNRLWAVGEDGMLLTYYDPSLRVIQTSYWAVEQSSKDILSWGHLKKREQRSLPSVSPLTNQLYQNYPNPFNPETWLPYQLAKDSEVTIRIYDVKGRLVRKLLLGKRKAGWYLDKQQAARWDGKNSAGHAVPSGVYFYTLTASGYTATRKLVLLK